MWFLVYLYERIPHMNSLPGFIKSWRDSRILLGAAWLKRHAPNLPMWQVPRELLVCNVCNTVPGLGMVWHGAKESVVIVKGMNLDDNLGSLGSWQFEFELGSFSHENYHGTAKSINLAS